MSIKLHRYIRGSSASVVFTDCCLPIEGRRGINGKMVCVLRHGSVVFGHVHVVQLVIQIEGGPVLACAYIERYDDAF